MTAIASALRSGHARRPPLVLLLGPAMLLVVLAVTARAVSQPTGSRTGIAFGAIVLVTGLALLAPRRALYVLLIWLPVLGLVRRLLDAVAPPPHADPLLLVAPAGVAVLLFVALAEGALRRRTVLSNAVLVLTVLLPFGAVNPLQSNVAGGLASLLLILVPVLGFWIGRTLGDASLAVVLKLVATVGVPAAVYGLFQTFAGFPSWDATWVRDSGYAALNVGGVIRPFSSFSSSAEYAYFAAIALVVWFAFGVRKAWLPLGAAACALLAVALFYESSRGVLLLATAAVALMVAARAGLRALPALAVGAAFLLVLILVMGRLVHQGSSASGAGALALHQAEGLAKPFDPQSSTLLGHLELVRHGLTTPLHDPLGTGLAGVTGIGGRLGDVQQADKNTEADPSNVAVALGAPGLVAFALVFFTGLSRAYGAARRTRKPLALAALGLLVATLFQWLNGAQYSVALLPWLLLGWLDQPDGGARQAPKKVRA